MGKIRTKEYVPKYATEEERRAARRETWRKYKQKVRAKEKAERGFIDGKCQICNGGGEEGSSKGAIKAE